MVFVLTVILVFFAIFQPGVIIPALAPARLKTGTTLGFQYAHRNGGQVVESFADTARFASWGAPVFWGRVRLGDGSSHERNEP